jgi:hypothetical protein
MQRLWTFAAGVVLGVVAARLARADQSPPSREAAPAPPVGTIGPTTTVALTTTGLGMPTDFPIGPYEDVFKRVTTAFQGDIFARTQLLSAWNAISYRYLECTDHEHAFATSVQAHGDSPAPPYRFEQEREMFGFFFSGLSSIESLGYGLYAIGALLDPAAFPEMATPAGNLQRVTFEATARAFVQMYPQQNVGAVLQGVVDDPQFREWRDHRNIQSHRTAITRTIFAGTVPTPPAMSSLGIAIEPQALAGRRAWLTDTLTKILAAADAFTLAEVP